jgi:putative membrane protein
MTASPASDPKTVRRGHVVLLMSLGAIVVWSWIEPKDRLTWWLDALPALVAAAVMIATYNRFRLTDLLYGLVWGHAIILLVSAHYTYAEVPLFDWIQEALNQSRNHYDRVGHVAQGFVPAIAARELLNLTLPLEPGKWLAVLVVLSCMGVSAIYELLEFAAAASTGDAAVEFLAFQGDVWDTQKDMLLALAGAVASLVLCSRLHDRQLAALSN